MYDLAQEEISSINGLGTINGSGWLANNALDLINTAGNVTANIISATKGSGSSSSSTNVGGSTATQSPVYIPVSTGTTEKKETNWTPFIIGGVALVAVLMFMNKK